MTPELENLARRVITCKNWRWMPGMRAIGRYPNYPVRIHDFGENVQDTDDMGNSREYLRWQQPIVHGDQSYEGPYLPDLSDPATLGCLIFLVREAWKSPVAQTSPSLPDGYLWTCYINDLKNDRLFREKTEAECLVAALESAP